MYNTKKSALIAVRHNGRDLQGVREKWKKDRQICLTAVQQTCSALQYVCEELKVDREFCLAAVQRNGKSLFYVTEELKMDRQICLAAVQQNGWALRYVCGELKKDREICLAAVKQNGWVFKHVCKELKKDKEICLAAVRQVITRYDKIQSVQEKRSVLWFVNKQIRKKRLPQTFIHDAAKFGLCWEEGMKELLWNAGQEIFQQDTESGLYPCILVASSNRSDLGTIYEMLKHCPGVLSQQQVSLKK